MQFDLVSPERRLVSVPVREVRLPGTEGDLTAMPGHAPTIVTLRPGIVSVVAEDPPPGTLGKALWSIWVLRRNSLHAKPQPRAPYAHV